MSELYKIQAPNLNNSAYGEDLRIQFENINSNFQKLSNYDFTKGEPGESVSIVPVDIKTNTELKSKIIDCLKEQLSQWEDKDWDTINSDFKNAIAKYNSEIGYNLLSDIELELETTTETDDDVVEKIVHGRYMYLIQVGDNVIGSLPFVYTDRRFHFDNLATVVSKILNDSEYKNIYDNAVDLSCVLYVEAKNVETDDRDYQIVASQTQPTLYYDQDSEQFCWKISGQETGIIASGPRGATGGITPISVAYVDSYDSSYKVEIRNIQKFFDMNGLGDEDNINYLSVKGFIETYAPTVVDEMGNLIYDKNQLIGWPVIAMTTDPDENGFWITNIVNIQNDDTNGYTIQVLCADTNYIDPEYNSNKLWKSMYDINKYNFGSLETDAWTELGYECKGYMLPAWDPAEDKKNINDKIPTKQAHMLYTELLEDNKDNNNNLRWNRHTLNLSFFDDISDNGPLFTGASGAMYKRAYLSNDAAKGLKNSYIIKDKDDKDITKPLPQFNIYYPTNIHYPMSIINNYNYNDGEEINNYSIDMKNGEIVLKNYIYKDSSISKSQSVLNYDRLATTSVETDYLSVAKIQPLGINKSLNIMGVYNGEYSMIYSKTKYPTPSFTITGPLNIDDDVKIKQDLITVDQYKTLIKNSLHTTHEIINTGYRTVLGDGSSYNPGEDRQSLYIFGSFQNQGNDPATALELTYDNDVYFINNIEFGENDYFRLSTVKSSNDVEVNAASYCLSTGADTRAIKGDNGITKGAGYILLPYAGVWNIVVSIKNGIMTLSTQTPEPEEPEPEPEEPGEIEAGTLGELFENNAFSQVKLCLNIDTWFTTSEDGILTILPKGSLAGYSYIIDKDSTTSTGAPANVGISSNFNIEIEPTSITIVNDKILPKFKLSTTGEIGDNNDPCNLININNYSIWYKSGSFWKSLIVDKGFEEGKYEIHTDGCKNTLGSFDNGKIIVSNDKNIDEYEGSGWPVDTDFEFSFEIPTDIQLGNNTDSSDNTRSTYNNKNTQSTNTNTGISQLSESNNYDKYSQLTHTVDVYGKTTLYGGPQALNGDNYIVSLDVHNNIINTNTKDIMIGNESHNNNLIVEGAGRFKLDDDKYLTINNDGISAPIKSTETNSNGDLIYNGYIKYDGAKPGQILMANGELTADYIDEHTPGAQRKQNSPFVVNIKNPKNTHTSYFAYDSNNRRFKWDLSSAISDSTYTLNSGSDDWNSIELEIEGKDNNKTIRYLNGNYTNGTSVSDDQIPQIKLYYKYSKSLNIVNMTFKIQIIPKSLLFDDDWKTKHIYTINSYDIQFPRPLIPQSIHIPMLYYKDANVKEDDVQSGMNLFLYEYEDQKEVKTKLGFNMVWDPRYNDALQKFPGTEDKVYSISFTYICGE